MVTMTMIMEGVVGRYGASLYDYDSMNPWWGCWGNRPFVFVPCDGLCILLIVRLDGSDYCKPFPRSLIVLGGLFFFFFFFFKVVNTEIFHPTTIYSLIIIHRTIELEIHRISITSY